MPVARRIIPCLDVKDGRVVKGVRFESLRDAGDPVACAAAYDAGGADELALLDISASHEGRATLLSVVRAVAEALFIPLTVGGGVRERADVDALLRAGADKVSVNSSAVATPSLIDEVAGAYGAQAFVVAIDARRVADNASAAPTGSAPLGDATALHPCWEVVTHGGRRATGLDAVQWAREVAQRGAGEILLTSMDRDGTGRGYDIALLQAVCSAVSVPVVASGGVGTLEHMAAGLRPVAHGGGGASAALAATIFHDGRYTIAEARRYLRDAGLPVRRERLHERALVEARTVLDEEQPSQMQNGRAGTAGR